MESKQQKKLKKAMRNKVEDIIKKYPYITTVDIAKTMCMSTQWVSKTLDELGYAKRWVRL